MKRWPLIILIAAALAVGLAVALYFLLRPPSPSTSPGRSFFSFPLFGSSAPTPGGTTPISQTPSASTTVISKADGAQITVSDFKNASSTVKNPFNTEGYYILIGNEPKAPYTIDFSDSDSSFGISLNKEPIGSVRLKAEQDLKERLGIGEEDMCNLNYRLAVGPGVNPIYDGRNLGFSFCPGATVLPAD